MAPALRAFFVPLVVALLFETLPPSATSSIAAAKNEDVDADVETGRRFRREVTAAELTQIREAVKALEDDAKKAATKNKALNGMWLLLL